MLEDDLLFIVNNVSCDEDQTWESCVAGAVFGDVAG